MPQKVPDKKSRLPERAVRHKKITVIAGIAAAAVIVAILLVSVITEASHTGARSVSVAVSEPGLPHSDTDREDSLATDTDEQDVPEPDTGDTETDQPDTQEILSGQTDGPDETGTEPPTVDDTDSGTGPAPQDHITDVQQWLYGTVMNSQISAVSAGDAEDISGYLKGGAPLRWALAYDDGGTVSYVKRYPDLSYYYYSISEEKEFAFDADRVRYAASLSKLPFIYSVLLELEHYENDPDPALEQHYDLDAEWIYEPYTMFREGSGIIQEEKAGFKLTVGELFEYAIKYSDNIAFAWLQEHFGLDSYFSLLDRLWITGGRYDPYMDFSARDCGKILYSVYRYFESGTELAEKLKSWMIGSDLGLMIARYYPEGTAPHKYGWDIDSFHDMVIILEPEPYIFVVMTDYEDGDQDDDALDFFAKITEMTIRLNASVASD